MSQSYAPFLDDKYSPTDIAFAGKADNPKDMFYALKCLQFKDVSFLSVNNFRFLNLIYFSEKEGLLFRWHLWNWYEICG